MRVLTRALVSFHHHRIHVPRVARVARALAEGIGRARSLLDVGAGDGSVALAIGEKVGAARIEGVDVKVRPETMIPVLAYDGETLPYEDGAFEAVVLSDVLHHCESPGRVLAEALRVASRVVAVKDHFRFGPVSEAILWAMDVVGNAAPGVVVRGHYFTQDEWARLVRSVGGRVSGQSWPLRIHDPPFRWITQDRLQFVATVEHQGRDE